MILGFSDAEIVVAKRGVGVREQGALCEYIGDRVCPKVVRLLDDGYEMELLAPPEYHDNPNQVRNLYFVLDIMVWSKPECLHPNMLRGGDWLESLKRWSMANAPWLLAWIERCYPSEPTSGYSCIHGDPTLANLMMRHGKCILTDPMPRLAYRREIPNRKEVDHGKIIQSCVGWENMLGCEHAFDNQEDLFLNWIKPSERPLALLWAAIHLARLGRRAPGKGRESIAIWAFRQSHRLAEKIKEC